MKRTIKSIAFVEMILLVSMSLAVSFLISDNFVSAEIVQGSQVTSLITPGRAADVNAGLQGGGAGSFATDATASVASGGATGLSGTLGYSKNIPIFGTTTSPIVGHLYTGLTWSILAVGAIQLIGNLVGLNKGLTNSLSYAAFGGIMAGQLVTGALSSGSLNSLVASNGNFLGVFGSPGAAGFGVGLVVAVAIFILTYSSQKKKLVNFQCLPFEPALGGSKCEECNKDSFRPCSEYRCRSLGQACQLLNIGTKQETCAWVSRNDVKSPTITPWTSVLSPVGLKYIPDTAIRPPAIGTKIVTGSNGCLPAFTPLKFGITTDEPAQCKLDYNHTIKFDEMQYYFGDTNYYQYNHTQAMRLPGPNTGNQSIAPELKNDGNFALYTRCRDANGNENVDEYVFSFCVDKGPDTTPPVIEGFSIPSGSPVSYNQDKVPIEVYVNEPSDCKWDIESKSYDEMKNPLSCNKESYQVNANLQYTCSGNLTGIKNREDNKFYFRCKDQPDKPDNERNVNVQSKELILKGSQPLNIISSGPNGTIIGSTDVVKVDLTVETDDGAEEGKAACSFSPTGEKDSYIVMFETNSFKHKQTLTLTNGNYTYHFRCIDAGGNAAESITTFNVFIDKQPPRITRVYKQEALKIVTNEDAECTYSLTSCNFNFEEGLKMIYSNPDIKNNLFAEWKASSTYHVKCRDLYGNEPSPNQCSIVVSAVELTAKKI